VRIGFAWLRGARSFGAPDVEVDWVRKAKLAGPSCYLGLFASGDVERLRGMQITCDRLCTLATEVIYSHFRSSEYAGA